MMVWRSFFKVKIVKNRRIGTWVDYRQMDKLIEDGECRH